jgi:hypothetical protein
MHDALNDLHAYVLALDAERQHLGGCVNPLAKLVSQEADELVRRRAEITEELSAVRTMMTTFRAVADPAGTRL